MRTLNWISPIPKHSPPPPHPHPCAWLKVRLGPPFFGSENAIQIVREKQYPLLPHRQHCWLHLLILGRVLSVFLVCVCVHPEILIEKVYAPPLHHLELQGGTQTQLGSGKVPEIKLNNAA